MQIARDCCCSSDRIDSRADHVVLGTHIDSTSDGQSLRGHIRSCSSIRHTADSGQLHLTAGYAHCAERDVTAVLCGQRNAGSSARGYFISQDVRINAGDPNGTVGGRRTFDNQATVSLRKCDVRTFAKRFGDDRRIGRARIGNGDVIDVTGSATHCACGGHDGRSRDLRRHSDAAFQRIWDIGRQGQVRAANQAANESRRCRDATVCGNADRCVAYINRFDQYAGSRSSNAVLGSKEEGAIHRLDVIDGDVLRLAHVRFTTDDRLVRCPNDGQRVDRGINRIRDAANPVRVQNTQRASCDLGCDIRIISDRCTSFENDGLSCCGSNVST